MQLGIFSVMDFHPEQQGSAAGFYRETIELAVKAEQLGYDSAWVAEHHFANYGLCPATSRRIVNMPGWAVSWWSSC
jgi:alkanesulfonate monooxygenase SsuD/methylene tetrahydromethanopterin reductase-like flavin-dependent oxidoreductase (luciferase family)